jgi:hypothetical protein
MAYKKTFEEMVIAQKYEELLKSYSVFDLLEYLSTVQAIAIDQLLDYVGGRYGDQ